MPFHEGEVYRCQEIGCGCELTVTKAAPPDRPGQQAPACCGTTMIKETA